MSLYQHLLAKLFPPDAGLPGYVPQFRLEGRPKDADTEEGLAMRIADPLWMLGRQWQFGEFLAEDNGSPISARVHYHRRRLNRFGIADEAMEPVDLDQLPLEYHVERIPEPRLNLRQRVQAGHQLERLILVADPDNGPETVEDLRRFFPVDQREHEELDAESRQFLQLMRGRATDGQRIWEVVAVSPATKDSFAAAWEQYAAWFRRQFRLEDSRADSTWDSTQLLHRFRAGYEDAGESIELLAPDYRNGQLDWYAFDSVRGVSLDTARAPEISDPLTPTTLSFSTMPDKRLYTFEDNRVDLGSMRIDPADLMRILIMNFSFLSSNDWFSIPFDMAIGDMVWVDHIEVVDTFGIKTMIKNGASMAAESAAPVGPVLDANPLKAWDVFKIRDRNLPKFDPTQDFLLLAPSLAFGQESAPIEEVLFLRDEFANMVWGLEKTVANALGRPHDGYDQHLTLNGPFLEEDAAPTGTEDTDTNPLPVYQLASRVPFNWIPYLPVHRDDREDEIELVRARMVYPGDGRTIDPLTNLITRDLARLREEAIPRAGTRVQLARQRIRWTDGETYTWLGRKVLPGRGEGSSGLRFDWLKN